METVAGLSLFPVQMTKNGQVFDANEVTALMRHVASLSKPVDLLVLSHGWNNDMAEARALYTELLGNIGPLPGRNVVVAGVFWPSKKFAESELIPAGGIASTGDRDAAMLKWRLADLADTFDGGGVAQVARLAELVDRLGESGARVAFVQGLRDLLPADLGPDDDGAEFFLQRDAEALFAALDLDVTLVGPEQGAGGIAGGGLFGGSPSQVAGGVAGSGGSGSVAAANRLLNLTTFYQMKTRAGVVGAGLNLVLAQIRAKIPSVRIHLVGHSFGARLVTAAVDGQKPFGPSSLTLLQGAFSHNGLSTNFDGARNGAFHNVIDQDKVNGPIAVTHTANDQAVGRAYAFASRLAGDDQASFGDESDRFGGIGRNGAIKLKPEKVVKLSLPAAGRPIVLTGGKVNNLRSDSQIHGHGDVGNHAVAALVRAALG